MAKLNNQKGKILYLERILRGTGENRTVTMQEILAALAENGIAAERKSIYDDLDVLRCFGMDIKYRRGRPGGYYLAGQDAPAKSSGQAPENKAPGTDVKTDGSRQKELPDIEKNSGEGQNTALRFHFFEETDGRERKQIKLLCTDSRREEIYACLGDHAKYKKKDNGYFTATVQAAECPEFYGWLTAMGRDVHILKPKKAALAYRDYLKGIAKEYKGIEQ